MTTANSVAGLQKFEESELTPARRVGSHCVSSGGAQHHWHVDVHDNEEFPHILKCEVST